MDNPPLDPQYKGHWGPSIIGLLASLNALVVIITILRITTRIYIVRSFWWDDLTIIFATLGTAIGGALGCLEVTYGFGTREAYLTHHQIIEFQKYTYGEWIQTFFTLMWTKVSICLFLMRIPQSQALRRPLQWTVGFLIISNTVLATMWVMSCQPIRASWDLSGDGGCLSHDAKAGIIFAQAIISLASDFAFALFPIVVLWRVQICFRTKVELWALMCLGFITGACCLVRTVINNQALPEDGSHDGIVNWVWRTFEVQIGIIAACVPALRPLYMRMTGSGRKRDSTLGTNVRFVGARGKSPDQFWVEDAPSPVSRGRAWNKSPTKERFEADSDKEVTRMNYVPRYPAKPQKGALRGPFIQEHVERERQGRKVKHSYGTSLGTSLGDAMAKYGIKRSPEQEEELRRLV